MTKEESDLKAKLHIVIKQAGYDGMCYMHGDLTETEYRIRQALLEDQIFSFITHKEGKDLPK